MKLLSTVFFYLKKYFITIILCANALWILFCICELRNESLKNAILQNEIKQAAIFNYNYFSSQNINWKNYLDELEKIQKERLAGDNYYSNIYINACKKM
jgi:hypothetical protein